MTTLRLQHLGSNLAYARGLMAMRAAMRAIDDEGPALLLLEHAPTLTLTRSGGERWLKKPRSEIEAGGIEVCEADRGGDVTFHGPGQLVGYPITRLSKHADGHLDLHGYLQRLQNALLFACEELGVENLSTLPSETGVWVGDRKLVAIGVGVGHRGVTRHGFALNISIDARRYTDVMVPCGLAGRGVTTLKQELGARCPHVKEIERVVVAALVHGLGFSGCVPMAARNDRDGSAQEHGAQEHGAQEHGAQEHGAQEQEHGAQEHGAQEQEHGAQEHGAQKHLSSDRDHAPGHSHFPDGRQATSEFGAEIHG